MNRDLVESAQHGDREAFGILARTHADRLFAIAQRILRDLDRTEDAVQQTLVIAWRKLPSLRDPDRFEAWLHRLLVHTCYREARRRRVWSTNVRELPVDGPALADHAAGVATRDELERAFRRLSPEHRALLVLHHYLGYAPAEIAETLDIPAGTARSRLHYAHRAMRAALEADQRPGAALGDRSA